jgi:hypothetical protein
MLSRKLQRECHSPRGLSELGNHAIIPSAAMPPILIRFNTSKVLRLLQLSPPFPGDNPLQNLRVLVHPGASGKMPGPWRSAE